MPLELTYYDKPFTVAPVRLADGSLGLNIDGEHVRVNPDKVADAREGQILSGTISRNPTNDELVAMFVPQAFSGHFLTPKVIFEGDPNINQLIANSAGISLEEYNLWEQLLARY